MQRPTVFLPRLRASPWWDSAEFLFVSRLEAAFGEVRGEVAALFGGTSSAGGRNVELRQGGGGPGKGSLLGHCDWARAGDAGWRRTDAGRAGWRKVTRLAAPLQSTAKVLLPNLFNPRCLLSPLLSPLVPRVAEVQIIVSCPHILTSHFNLAKR
jgi:hypothetical protein